MRLAVVAGGWHFPGHFFRTIAAMSSGVDLYVVSHRNPELPIVREEKRDMLAKATGPLADLDRELYADFPMITDLRRLGWNYMEAPNTVGDFEFFNQWMAVQDYRRYDVILNCHDDTYIRRPDLFEQLGGDWLLLANGKYPEAPEGYVRGSFEFWKRELLDMLGGHIDIGRVGLTREGQTDSPQGLNALSEWNRTGEPLRDFMVRKNLLTRIGYLSSYYRVSPFVIEGERGFLRLRGGAPWSFEKGLEAYPIEVLA